MLAFKDQLTAAEIDALAHYVRSLRKKLKPRREAKWMKEVDVALIGHRFMGRAHSNAYRQVCRSCRPGSRRA